MDQVSFHSVEETCAKSVPESVVHIWLRGLT